MVETNDQIMCRIEYEKRCQNLYIRLMLKNLIYSEGNQKDYKKEIKKKGSYSLRKNMSSKIICFLFLISHNQLSSRNAFTETFQFLITRNHPHSSMLSSIYPH